MNTKFKFPKKVSLCGVAVFAACFASACSGDSNDSGTSSTGSGLDTTKQLLQLSMEETSQLCTWTMSVQPTGDKTCPDGTMVSTTTSTQQQCQSEVGTLTADCTATVADYEHCATADDCDLAGYLTACQAVLACQSGGINVGMFEQVDCGDGTMGDKCDGFNDCANGADEMNCP